MKQLWLLLIPLFSYISLDLKAQVVAEPLKGEGVYAFLNRHKLDPAKYTEEFYTLNSGKFGKDTSLLSGVSSELPGYKLPITEPLYGDDLKTVNRTSDKMQGAVIYLVSGHGGPDPGAMGTYGGYTLHEDEYAYDITLRLARKLQENGATVYLLIQDANDGIRNSEILPSDIHETCMGETIPLSQKQRLRQRAKKVNELYKKDEATYKRCIILHVDSRSKSKKIDVFFYHHAKSKSGKNSATTLRDVMEEKYYKVNPNRGFDGTVSSRNLYMLHATTPPTIFIELGNIQNYRDQLRVVKPNNRQALANWLYDGLEKDYRGQ